MLLLFEGGFFSRAAFIGEFTVVHKVFIRNTNIISGIVFNNWHGGVHGTMEV